MSDGAMAGIEMTAKIGAAAIVHIDVKPRPFGPKADQEQHELQEEDGAGDDRAEQKEVGHG
jgi:hypothetical protein